MPINFWGNPGSLFDVAGGFAGASLSLRVQQGRAGGGNHIWSTWQTPGSTFVNGGVNTYTLMLSGQDRLGEVWNYSIPVTTINSPIAFGAGVLFSASAGVASGGVFWYEPTTSDVNGPYVIKYQTLSYTFDLVSVLSGETATPPAITLGSAISLGTISSVPRSYDWNNGSTGLQLFTAVDGATSTVVDVYFQSFTPAGTANTSSILVLDDFSNTAVWGSFGAGTATWPFGIIYEDSSATRSVIIRSIDPATGAIGAPTTITTGYADVFGVQVRQFSTNEFLIAVTGVTSGGVNSITVYKTNSALSVQSSTTITLTSPASTVRIQSDVIPGDKVVLVYNDNGAVQLAQYDVTGALLSTDPISGFSSFDRARSLGDGRVEIVGRVANGDNNFVSAQIIDTRVSGALNPTLTASNDTFAGTAFNDTINGGAGNDRLAGGWGDDTINGDDGNDYIDGGEGNDSINGGNDNDTIEGGNGNDSLDGGAGSNTVSYIDATGAVTVNLGTVAAQNTGGAGTDTLANFTSIQGSAFDDTLTGTAAANYIGGNGGNDFMRGLAGNDTFDGGIGASDMVAYDNDSLTGGNAAVVVNLSASSVNFGGVVAAGTARDGFGNTDTLINIQEARGGAANDTLVGGAGYNFFQGRGGADTYDGGNSTAIGDDYGGIYFPDGYNWVDYRQDGGPSGVVITLTNGSGGNSGGTGTDTFGNSETFININAIRGSMLADTITGNSYFGFFQTLQGNDTLNGGGGYDVADYSRDAQYAGTGAVFVNLSGTSVTVGAVVVAAGTARDGWGGTDTLSNIERAYGTGGNDAFYGNAWDNQFRGFAGNDTMVGGDGFDDFRPGLGADSADGTPGANGNQSYDDRDRVHYADLTPSTGGLGVIVNLSGTSVTFETFTVAANTARDTGGSADTLIDIERARGTNGRDYFIGSLTANLREERFEGLGGADYFDGQAGFDLVTYQNETSSFSGQGFGGTMGIIANLSASAITVGSNTVQAGTARDSYGYTDTLVNIEGITGTAFADYMVGGAGYSYFRPWGGADTIDGGGGDKDFLSFFVDDAFFVTPGAGAVVNMVAGTAVQFQDGATVTFSNIEDIGGSERNDSITGNAVNNTLSGDDGADTIDGGDGDDTVNGGTGADSLVGGAGVDVVSYRYDPTEGAYNLLQRPDQTPAAWTGVTVNLATGRATDFAGNTDTLSGFEGVTGTFLNDSLTGDAQANFFYGLSGNDTIDGGDGIDTVTYANWGANDGSGTPVLVGINASRPNGVTVDLANGTASDSELGIDTLIRIENVIGSVGNDLFIASAVANVFDGAGGIDTLSYAAATSGAGLLFYMLAANLNGGDSAGDIYTNMENLIGTTTNDRIYMDNNDNSVSGNGGFDTVELYGGNDSYSGGSGFDYVLAGTGNDSISVGAGDSLIYGEDGNDTITAVSGSNSFYGGAGFDSITGGSNTDVIFAGIDGDTVNGGDGNDFIYGEDGADSISGGVGGDQIGGGQGADTINGDAGADVILGGTENDSISGGTEDDFLFGEAGNDTISGGTGVDQIQGGIGNDSLNGDVGGDVAFGGDDNDTINGGADGDFLFGELGADSLNGDDGADQLFGGNGNDTVNGGLGNDVIFGDDGDDSLSGGSELGSVNFMLGGNGNDTIAGGVGQDQMWGGTGSLDTGNDVFVIGAGGGFDIIFDFQAGAALGDQISLAGTGITSFTQLVTENRITQAGSYTHIALGGGNDVFLAGVTAASMVSNDFIF